MRTDFLLEETIESRPSGERVPGGARTAGAEREKRRNQPTTSSSSLPCLFGGSRRHDAKGDDLASRSPPQLHPNPSFLLRSDPIRSDPIEPRSAHPQQSNHATPEIALHPSPTLADPSASQSSTPADGQPVAARPLADGGRGAPRLRLPLHPTDENLCRRRVDSIAETDLYRLEAWDLPSLSCICSRDSWWYFFSRLARKVARAGAKGRGGWDLG